MDDLRWQQINILQQVTELRADTEMAMILWVHIVSDAVYDKIKKHYEFIRKIEKKLKKEFMAGFTALQQVWRDNLGAIGEIISAHMGSDLDFGFS